MILNQTEYSLLISKINYSGPKKAGTNFLIPKLPLDSVGNLIQSIKYDYLSLLIIEEYSFFSEGHYYLKMNKPTSNNKPNNDKIFFKANTILLFYTVPKLEIIEYFLWFSNPSERITGDKEE